MFKKIKNILESIDNNLGNIRYDKWNITVYQHDEKKLGFDFSANQMDYSVFHEPNSHIYEIWKFNTKLGKRSTPVILSKREIEKGKNKTQKSIVKMIDNHLAMTH